MTDAAIAIPNLLHLYAGRTGGIRRLTERDHAQVDLTGDLSAHLLKTLKDA